MSKNKNKTNKLAWDLPRQIPIDQTITPCISHIHTI